MVKSFNYLGRVILAADDYWPVVIQNMKNRRAVWRRMTIILISEGNRARVYVFFSKAVVHLVLLFGEETRVVTPHMRRVLRGFQDQV